jgi:hypothetical protein
MTPTQNSELTIRSARDADLDDIDDMITDFVKGHPAQGHPRSRSKLHQAYFGAAPVARLVVATRREHVIGMCQWTLMNASRWDGARTNAMSRLKRSSRWRIWQAWHLETSFAGSPSRTQQSGRTRQGNVNSQPPALV